MEKFIDRVLIYIFCILFSFIYDMGIAAIIAMLISIIFTSLESFFDNRIVSVILNIIYFVFSLIYPEFAVFIPVMVYNCICRKNYYLAAIYILPFLKYLLKMSYLLPMLSLGIYMAVRIVKTKNQEFKFLKVQERSLQLESLLKEKQAEMSKHQDYEIRMATVNERNRIAREIHDNVGHMLSRSILQAGAIQTINKEEVLKEPLVQLQNTLNMAMTSIRESVHDLKDDSVDVKLMVDGIIREYESLSIRFDYDIDREMPKDMKYCFVAIIKEALTNVVKHSDASDVNIIIREHPALYQLMIMDNGSIAPEMKGDGIGMENMRERVAAFNGNIRFTFDNGFKIFVSIKKNYETENNNI